jgi:integrase
METTKARRNSNPRQRKQRNHFTREELLDILQTAKDKSQRDYTMFLILYKHCMRSAEICDLTLSCVRPSVTRPQELHIERRKGSLTTDQAINDCAGIPLLSEKKAIHEWLAVRPPDGSDFLFNSQKGQLSRETVSRLFLHYCQKTSEKRIAAGQAPIADSTMFVHNLRHSRLNHLVGKTDLYNLKSLAGHRAITSTMVYLTPDQRQAVSEAHRVDMATF